MYNDISSIKANHIDSNYDSSIGPMKSSDNLVRLTKDEIDEILKNSPNKPITLKSGLLDIDHAFKTNKALGSVMRDLNESKPTYFFDVYHGVTHKKKQFTKSENHSSEKTPSTTQPNKEVTSDVKNESDVKKCNSRWGFSKVMASASAIATGASVTIIGMIRLIKDTIDLCTKVNNDDEYSDIGDDSASRAVSDKIDSDFKSYQEAINSGDEQKIADIKEEMEEKYVKTAVGDFVFSSSYVKPEYSSGELSDIANSARQQGINSAKQTAKDINKSDFAIDSSITGTGLLILGTSLSAYSKSKKDIENNKITQSHNTEEAKAGVIDSGSKFESLGSATFPKSQSIHSEREQFATASDAEWK